MKKAFRIGLALMLALALCAGAAAFAADSTITYKGEAQGFGFAPGSEYTATDLFDGFKNAMPGDTLTETVTFTNDAADCDYVKLYMRARAHDESNPLSPKVNENEDLATMNDFLSQLSMTVYNGTTLIYDDTPDREGDLADNVLLGTFRRGETATLRVVLEVPIELDNTYADRVGEVDWVFLVEALDDPVPTATPTARPDGTKPSKTGDEAMPLVWLGIAVAACGGVAVLLTARKKRG